MADVAWYEITLVMDRYLSDLWINIAANTPQLSMVVSVFKIWAINKNFNITILQNKLLQCPLFHNIFPTWHVECDAYIEIS